MFQCRFSILHLTDYKDKHYFLIIKGFRYFFSFFCSGNLKRKSMIKIELSTFISLSIRWYCRDSSKQPPNGTFYTGAERYFSVDSIGALRVRNQHFSQKMPKTLLKKLCFSIITYLQTRAFSIRSLEFYRNLTSLQKRDSWWKFARKEKSILLKYAMFFYVIDPQNCRNTV